MVRSMRKTGWVRAAAAVGVVAALISTSACSPSDDAASGATDLESQSAGAMKDYSADEQFKATEKIDLGLLWTDWAETPVTKTWEVFKEIEKRTNVSLDLTHIPFSDAKEKRSLLISAGDAPDVIPLVYTGEEAPFVSSGAVLPMSDYVKYMPNFQKYVKEWDLGDMLERLKQADGKYYMLPGLHEVSVPTFTLIIRQDVFDEVGAPQPDTWEHLKEGLELIKAKYPDSHPLADGFEGQSMLNYAAHAFGTQAGWGFADGTIWNKDKKKLEYAGANQGYKDMVTYFNSLYEEGLLDPESFTKSDDGGGVATISEKIAKNQVFAASGASGTVNEFATALDATENKGKYKLVQIAPPGGEAGMVVEPRNFWNGFMLSSKVKDSPHFLATLQFLDWLYYSPAATEMMRWGVEGQTYSKDGDKITLNPEFSLNAFNINPGAKTDIKTDLGYSNDVLTGSTESRSLQESYNSEQYVEYIDTVLSSREPRDPNPPAPLTESELEQASLKATPLSDAVKTNTLKFILGQRDLSEWDDYVNELKAGGMDDYVKLIDDARKRFAKENG
ncbi:MULTISPECIES: extracellular solute-binding protein [unclassified Microbacterium]|uniref:ABC transporter substrate-binding protein n=1 Tax=unclassified Microbacterium TaxID=2609290 RepID=UPI0012F8A46C|nr:extracellular solute-binding protein [Microbacterium sp. MAH-37]MVQ42685.1 extracellular solute-binding protein [Microbacterium sp. MAH-37]